MNFRLVTMLDLSSWLVPKAVVVLAALVMMAGMAADCLAEEPHGESEFSVMTWNLEWFFDDSRQDNFSDLAKKMASPDRGRWNWRRDRVSEAIAKVKPTVLAVQEVESRRILWYLTRSLENNHQLEYDEYLIEGTDHFTEQDVGLLVTKPADVFAVVRGNRSGGMQDSSKFGSVSKHLIAMLEVPVNGKSESVVIVNVHFRSKAEGASIRAKQAASVSAWIDRLLSKPTSSPSHLIVLGDFNTEQPAGQVQADSELGILMSRGTDDRSDDLVDLHDMMPASERQTHLLSGKQFDRILVSRSLVDDEPGRPDLVLKDVRVLRDLAIRGGVDDADEHWNDYWGIADDSRDLSDHYPVMARFETR